MFTTGPAFWGGGPPDPYFSSVQLLTPFADASGTVTGFYDVKGNTWSITATQNPEMVIETDAARTLFGLNTLRLYRQTGQSQEAIYTDSTKIGFTSTTGFCLEYWIWQSAAVGNAAVVPMHAMYSASNAGVPDASRKIGVATTGNTGLFETFTGGATNGPYAFTFNTWNYVVLDYDPVASKTYVYMNGVLIATYIGAQLGGANWPEGYLALDTYGSFGVGIYPWDVSIGQVRLTSRPRYAGAATITVPTAAWPQH